MVYGVLRKELKNMEHNLMVAQATMIAMALAGIFTVALPLGLGIFFWKRTGGRWRFFFLGCVIFPVFAMVLEQQVHRLLLGGPLGPALQGNLWLYALYAGLMAGAFEECGRWLAFKLTLRWSRGPEDALMYGAGHGGIEAVLLAGMTMLNNIIISLALNRGGLAAVEDFMGPIPEAGMAAIQGMAAAPAGLYFWTAFERLSAVGLHIALSVLVYTAVRKRGEWYWFPAAILIHTLVDMAAVLTNALFPVAVTEGTTALLTLGMIFLARKIYLDEKQKTS